MSPEDVLSLLQGLDQIKELTTHRAVVPEEEDPSELIRLLETKGGKTALTQARIGGRKKAHWKEKKRKQRERMRPYMASKYREERLPKRTKLLEDGDWYAYYLMEWKKRGYKIELSEEEWVEYVAPGMSKDSVPVLFRMNTAKPVSLHNILIRDQETKAVLFDGQEWMLKRLGATE